MRKSRESRAGGVGPTNALRPPSMAWRRTRRDKTLRHGVAMTGAAVAAAAALLCGPLTSGPARAAVSWDPGGLPASPGGTGTWNTVAPQWTDGTSAFPWTNDGSQSAIFAGPAGTVTLGVPI